MFVFLGTVVLSLLLELFWVLLRLIQWAPSFISNESSGLAEVTPLLAISLSKSILSRVSAGPFGYQGLICYSVFFLQGSFGLQGCTVKWIAFMQHFRLFESS